ncbi:MAG TPA: YncE family protein [Actinoallomurus sp.]|jgi:DNA-binding beta-propeller fold protein YncE
MRLPPLPAVVLLAVLGAGCASATRPRLAPRPSNPRPSARVFAAPPTDVYAYDRPGMLSPAVRDVPARVYVPDSLSGDVIVFDQRTFRQVDRFPVGRRPQHVVPSWDLRTLWVNDNDSGDLVPIDPRTGRHGRPVPVADPYNLYFTMDGRFAVVMAERLNRIDFRDARTMRPVRSVNVPCRGPNHADFSVNGDFFLTACEFSGDLIKVDVQRQKVVNRLRIGGMPQDVKLSPDGRTFYVADMQSGGVWTVDAATFRKTGFIRTGKGAHGLYVSRDSQTLYVSNRGEGSITLISFATHRAAAKWYLRGGGSPDMGGVSADGKVLWLSGRYDSVVYAISTTNGRLIAKLKVGRGPHGLCVYPQPGRYSLGHTGVFR